MHAKSNQLFYFPRLTYIKHMYLKNKTLILLEFYNTNQYSKQYHLKAVWITKQKKMTKCSTKVLKYYMAFSPSYRLAQLLWLLLESIEIWRLVFRRRSVKLSRKMGRALYYALNLNLIKCSAIVQHPVWKFLFNSPKMNHWFFLFSNAFHFILVMCEVRTGENEHRF